MKLKNPYTRGCIEYPLFFEPEKLNYFIRHETPFEDRYREWAVSVIETGDVIYIPYGDNRCKDIYVVTRFFLNGDVKFPMGIYTVPMAHFTTKPRVVTGAHNDEDDNEFGDNDFIFDPYIID